LRQTSRETLFHKCVSGTSQPPSGGLEHGTEHLNFTLQPEDLPGDHFDLLLCHGIGSIGKGATDMLIFMRSVKNLCGLRGYLYKKRPPCIKI
jgi:hypothetical protein